MIKTIYIIGSLKNENILSVHKDLESVGLEPFSDWKCPGPDADDFLRDYYRERGLSYKEIIDSYGVQQVFNFDKTHLGRCDAAVLVMPAGKSGHLELGYCVGLGKPAFILMDGEPERVDVMHAFATEIFMSKGEMLEYFKSVECATTGSIELPSCEQLPASLGGSGTKEKVRREYLNEKTAILEAPVGVRVYYDKLKGVYFFYE